MPSKLNILMVEDNPDDVVLTKDMLGSRAFVTNKATLKEAFEELKLRSFDAILLDLGVPDSQGIETFETISRYSATVPPVIVLTSNDDEVLIQKTLTQGAQDYLLKSHLTPELLTRTVFHAIERYKFDQALRKNNRELIALNQSLAKARDIAVDASRSKSEFLANISHEIRTPLSGIVSIADLLIDECNAETVAEFHQILRESSRNLMATVNDLLDLSKMEAGKMIVNISEVNLRELIHEVAIAITPTAKKKGIGVETQIADGVPESIETDELRLKQAVLNFAHNAVKFTDSGKIIICANPDPDESDHVRVCVEDTGIGIKPELLKTIFDPFMQADGSMTRKYGGTGLGLAISEKAAALLEGDIGVTSEVGKGSTFWIRVPTRSLKPDSLS